MCLPVPLKLKVLILPDKGIESASHFFLIYNDDNNDSNSKSNAGKKDYSINNSINDYTTDTANEDSNKADNNQQSRLWW